MAWRTTRRLAFAELTPDIAASSRSRNEQYQRNCDAQYGEDRTALVACSFADQLNMVWLGPMSIGPCPGATAPGPFGGSWIVRDHDNGLAEFLV